MTDKELGLLLCDAWAETGEFEAVARRARELLKHEAVSVKLDYPQLDRIKSQLDDVEDALRWVHWRTEGLVRGKPEPQWPFPGRGVGVIACPRCHTYVGSLDEFHVCVESALAQFTRAEEQLAYITQRVDQILKIVEAALPPRAEHTPTAGESHRLVIGPVDGFKT